MSLPSGKIKWAIVGLGRIAEKFASDLNLNPDCEISLVASRNLKKAKIFAERHNAANSVEGYERVLDFKEEIDIVYIATPHSMHVPLSELFLGNGLNVICEKPLGMNAEEVLSVSNIARESGCFFMEALWSRFFPTLEKALDVLNSGDLGEIQSIRADFGFHFSGSEEHRVMNKELGGGALLDVGIYPLFLSLILLGQPDKIDAHSDWTSNDVDATTYMTLYYPGNCTAQLYCSIKNETDVIGEIYGSKGKMKLHSRFHHAERMSWKIYDDGFEEESESFEFMAPTKGFGYGYEIEEVVQCLRNNQTESDLWSLDDSYQLSFLIDEVAREAGIGYE